ncbi:hypothetical protein ACKKBG_A23575 [Auxenochlorella protothecoides x Auxenochlorella symbiontica]
MTSPDQVLGPKSRADALATVSGSPYVLVGCSSFQGQKWTGGIALIRESNLSGEAAGLVQACVEMPAGVPALVCLSDRDPFTGQVVAVSGSDDGAVGVWSVSTGLQPSVQEASSVRWHDDIVSCIAPSGQASSQVVSTSWDGTAVLWDCTSTGPRRVSELRPGQHAVHAAAWCNSSVALATAADGCVFWDPRSGEAGRSGLVGGARELQREGVAPGPAAARAGLTAVAACENEQAVYLGTDAGGLLWLDRRAAGGGRPQTLASPHTEGIRQLLLGGENGSILASSDTAGKVVLAHTTDAALQRVVHSAAVPGGLALGWQGPQLLLGGVAGVRMLALEDCTF